MDLRHDGPTGDETVLAYAGRSAHLAHSRSCFGANQYIALAAELIEQHKSGAIRILAMADTARSPSLPDVPTLKERGIDIDAPGWFAFYAPARTPRNILGRLEEKIIAATHAPDTRAKILAMGFQSAGTTS